MSKKQIAGVAGASSKSSEFSLHAGSLRAQSKIRSDGSFSKESRSANHSNIAVAQTAANSFFGYTDLEKVFGVPMKYRYHRSTLTGSFRKCYDYILHVVVSIHSPTIHIPEDCSGITDAEVEKIRTAINYDFPELYGVQISKTVRIQKKLHSIKIVYDPSFHMINDVLDKIDRLLVSTLNKRISENPNQTDYIREMTTVAWMKSHCKYDARSPNRSNITGFFFNKHCACEGYARSFLFLCNRLGIPCIFVTGRSNGPLVSSDSSGGGSSPSSHSDRGHCWNMVQLEGVWYYTDITWCSVIGLKHPDTGKVVFPNYFINISKDLYDILHVEDHPFPLPSNSPNIPLDVRLRHNYYFTTGFVWTVTCDKHNPPLEKNNNANGELMIPNESVVGLCKLLLMAISKGKQFIEILIRMRDHDPFGIQTITMRNMLKDPRLWTLINTVIEETQQLNKYISPCAVMVPQGKYPAAMIFFKLVSVKPKITPGGKPKVHMRT